MADPIFVDAEEGQGSQQNTPSILSQASDMPQPVSSVRVSPTPQEKPSKLTTQEVLERMYSFDSISKADYFKTRGTVDEVIKPAKSTVFMGNFVTNTAERIRRGQTIGNMEILADAAFMAGESILAGTEQMDRERGRGLIEGKEVFGFKADELFPVTGSNEAQVFGHKVRNFSFFIQDKAQKMLQEREAIAPLPKGLTPDRVAGDVGNAILTSLAVFTVLQGAAVTAGATAPVAGAFAASAGGFALGAPSGFEAFRGARKAGRSIEESQAYAAFTTLAIGKLEQIGLKNIFNVSYFSGVKTAVKGLSAKVAALRVGQAVASEGITEGAQTAVELGVGTMSGAIKDKPVMEYVGDIIYAAAVGSIAGGTMATSVAIPQRQRAINILKAEMGLSHPQAVKVVDETMQATMEESLNKTAEAYDFDELANDTTQKIFKKVEDRRAIDIRGDFLDPRKFEREKALAEFNALKKEDQGEAYLRGVRAQLEADVRSEEAKGVRVNDAAEAFKTGEIIDAQEMERQVMAGETPAEGEATVSNFQVAEPDLDVSTTDEMRVAIKGRMKLLNEKIKASEKTLKGIQVVIEKLTGMNQRGEEALARMARLEAKEAEVFEELMDAYSEAEALRTTGRQQAMQGSEIKISSADMVRVTASLAKKLIASAKRNFILGRASLRAERVLLRQTLNRLVNRVGVSKDVRAVLKQRFSGSKFDTAEKLARNIPLIEDAVQMIQEQQAMNSLRKGVQGIVALFKGTRDGGRAGLRKVKLTPADQRVADAFVNEFEKADTNPQLLWKNAGSSREATMRFLASQLATGKNGVSGHDLTPKEYSDMFRRVHEFAVSGAMEANVQQEVEKRLRKELIASTVKDLKTSNLSVSDRVLAGFNLVAGVYDSALGLIARHSEGLLGERFAEVVFSQHNARRRAEVLNMYFRSASNEAAFTAYPELQGDYKKKQEKFRRDSLLGSDTAVIFEFNAGTEENPDMRTVHLSRLEAIEKYQLRQRPGMDKKMRKDKTIPWNDDAFAKLEEALSSQDKIYALELLKVYNELYDQINPVFEKLAGYSLPRDLNYSPVITKKDFKDDKSLIEAMFGKDGDFSSVQSQSYFKPLTDAETSLQNISAEAKLLKYIEDMTHYVGMAEAIDRAQHVFKSTEFVEVATEKYGASFLSIFDTYMDVLIKNTIYHGRQGALWRPVNALVGKATEGFIASKPFQFIKQSTSIFTGIEVTGVEKYFKYLKTIPEAWQSGELRELIDNAYFRARGQLRNMNRDMRIIEQERASEEDIELLERILGGKSKENIQKLRSYFDNPTFLKLAFLPTQAGDFIGTVGAGWPVYQYYIKDMGMTKEQALYKTIEFINATQQSPDVTQMPAWALNANPLVRSFFTFSQAPLQYINRILRILQTYGDAGGNWDWNKFAKVYALYFVFLPALFDYVSEVFRPDEEPEREWARRFLVGPLDDIPGYGKFYDWLATNFIAETIKATTGKEVRGREVKPNDFGVLGSMGKNLDDARKAFNSAIKEDYSTKSVLESLTEFSEASLPLTGTPGATVRQLMNTLEGINFMEEGSFNEKLWRRSFMALGASRYSTRTPGAKDQRS